MSANTQALGEISPVPPRQHAGYWKRYWKRYWKSIGGKFLVFSILAHLLFLAGAAYYIIEIIAPQRQKPIMVVPPSVNAIKDNADHNKIVQQQRENSSPLTPPKVAYSTGKTDIVINPPPLDAMQNTSLTPSIVPGSIGDNPFSHQGPSGPSGPGSNSRPTTFGYTEYKPGSLRGTFYDFKFLSDGQPAKNPDNDYKADITKFVMDGWKDSELDKYLKGNTPLYATQVFMPVVNTNEAPADFHSPKPESPGKWIVVYKGDVSPPASGAYHFVAAGDDDMIIRFDGRTVLFHCEHIPTPAGLEGQEYHYEGQRLGFARSLPLKVQEGAVYPIEILIGDDIPTKTFAKVLIEKEGTHYQAAPGGGPTLPVFALDKVQVTPETDGTPPLPHLDAPLWIGKTSPASLLEQLDRDNPMNPGR